MSTREKDPRKSLKGNWKPWCRKGTRIYESGLGVPKDYDRARQWYIKGAAAQDAGAMWRLGWMYLYGVGVAKDYQQASSWYEKATQVVDHSVRHFNEQSDARVKLGYIYENGGYGVAQDYHKALEWYLKGWQHCLGAQPHRHSLRDRPRRKQGLQKSSAILPAGRRLGG